MYLPVVQEWFDFDFSPAISLKTHQVYYTWEKGEAIQVELKTNPIWMVRREVFDYFLIQQAKKIGASIQDNTEVKAIEFKGDRWILQTSQEPITAYYVIAADGSMGRWQNGWDLSARKE